MKNYIYYIILKSYKGLLRKKHVGNTQLFFIPINNEETLYLAIIGKLTNTDDVYLCQLINRIPHNLRYKIVEEQKNEFKDRYVVLETVPCSSEENGIEQFSINVPKTGKYILSDLKLSFDSGYSTDRQRIYRLEGKINLETSEVSGFEVKAAGIKKLSLLRRKI